MATLNITDKESMSAAMQALQPGDCVQISCFADVAASTREMLNTLNALSQRQADLVSIQEGLDTRSSQGAQFFSLCRALAELDHNALRAKQREGIERAREEGRYRGRKPIPVDEDLFDSVTALWQAGQISAREAMTRLKLKPNTFYRRIKEREEQKMKDYKKVEQELKAEIKEAARQSRNDLEELKKQVRAEAKEVKKAAEEHLELHDVEKELRRDRRRAEAAHDDTVKQMKKDVEAEAKELKKLMEEK